MDYTSRTQRYRIISEMADSSLDSEINFNLSNSENLFELEDINFNSENFNSEYSAPVLEDRFLLDDILISCSSENESSSEDEISEYSCCSDKINILKINLIKWIILHNVSVNAATHLLKILREFGIDLPKTKDSLFRSTNGAPDSFFSKEVPPGEYAHFGIEKCINRYDPKFLSNLPEIICDFNVDGLPLYKSSRKTLWPILGSFVDDRNRPPFIVGAWVGDGHPISVDSFFKEFVNEFSKLKNEGILIGKNSIRKKFILRAFICDAPAKSFCKSVKYHNAIKGCH